MSVGYVDTSCLVAVAFGESGARALARRLGAYDALASSNLLEAELRAALRREGVEGGDDLLAGLAWVLPDRRLTAEIERVLAVRLLRGADLWHVATALYLAESPGDVDFLTLDGAQRETAAELGFSTPV
jgi:predicted nucleic acid-binding protein